MILVQIVTAHFNPSSILTKFQVCRNRFYYNVDSVLVQEHKHTFVHIQFIYAFTAVGAVSAF